jgi:hypothetical protein
MTARRLDAEDRWEARTVVSVTEIQENVRTRIVVKRDARKVMSVLSEFTATHEKVLRPDEVALFHRVQVLLQRLGW